MKNPKFKLLTACLALIANTAVAENCVEITLTGTQGGPPVFNTEQMNQAVFAFRRYEESSLNYTGIDSHEGLSSYGLYNTVVARE